MAFGKPLEVVTTPMPVPTGKEVLVKTTLCVDAGVRRPATVPCVPTARPHASARSAGMCHSDIHIWEGFMVGGGQLLGAN